MNEPLKGKIKRMRTGHNGRLRVKAVRVTHLKSAVEWYLNYLDMPIVYFKDYPKQLKGFWKYAGFNSDTMIKGELQNFNVTFNIWLVNKAFEDVTKEV